MSAETNLGQGTDPNVSNECVESIEVNKHDRIPHLHRKSIDDDIDKCLGETWGNFAKVSEKPPEEEEKELSLADDTDNSRRIEAKAVISSRVSDQSADRKDGLIEQMYQTMVKHQLDTKSEATHVPLSGVRPRDTIITNLKLLEITNASAHSKIEQEISA